MKFRFLVTLDVHSERWLSRPYDRAVDARLLYNEIRGALTGWGEKAYMAGPEGTVYQVDILPEDLPVWCPICERSARSWLRRFWDFQAWGPLDIVFSYLIAFFLGVVAVSVLQHFGLWAK